MHRYNLRNGNVISGALLAALGIYIVAQAHAWSYYTPDGPGPGFFPTWYGILMIALALGLIISTARKPKPEAAPAPRARRGLGRALTCWLAFAACIAAMNVLGFSISFALFTFCLVVFVFQRPVIAAALTAVGSTAAFYVVFPYLLGVQLPKGWVGF